MAVLAAAMVVLPCSQASAIGEHGYVLLRNGLRLEPGPYRVSLIQDGHYNVLADILRQITQEINVAIGRPTLVLDSQPLSPLEPLREQQIIVEEALPGPDNDVHTLGFTHSRQILSTANSVTAALERDARIGILPVAFTDTQHPWIIKATVLHEMLHALGVGHVDGLYHGRLQTMNPTLSDPVQATLGDGDINALRELAGFPVVHSVDPPSGSVGSSLVIAGENFLDGSTSVFFGGTRAESVTVLDRKRISVAAPRNAEGPVQITVETRIGRSAPGGTPIFVYNQTQGPLSLPVTRGWNQATVDSPQSTGSQAVVLKDRGMLVVANRASDGSPRVGRYNATNRTWQFQRIGSANCSGRSLAGVVYNGAFHILATGQQAGQPSVCHLSSADGQAWQEEHLDVGQSSGLGLSATIYQGRINLANRGNETSPGSGVYQIRQVFQGPQGWGAVTLAADASPNGSTSVGEYGGQFHALYESSRQEVNHFWYNPAPIDRWSRETLATGVAVNTAMNISNYSGQFHLNYEAAGNQIIHRWYDPQSGRWGQETIAADMLHGSNIATATYGNQYHLVYGAAGNRLAHRWYDATTGRWYNEPLDNGNVTAVGGLSMIEYNGNFHILTTTPTNGLRHSYYQP